MVVQTVSGVLPNRKSGKLKMKMEMENHFHYQGRHTIYLLCQKLGVTLDWKLTLDQLSTCYSPRELYVTRDLYFLRRHTAWTVWT